MATFPFNVADFDLSKFDPRNAELPFDLPNFDVPSAEQLSAYARDAAYVGIGLAVMTAERLQALQSQLIDGLKDALDRSRN